MSALFIPIQAIGLAFSFYMYTKVAKKPVRNKTMQWLWAFVTPMWAILLYLTAKSLVAAE